MLPVAARASHGNSLGSISELSEFSLVPPDDEEQRDCQTVDAPVGGSGRSESFSRHRSSYDTDRNSGHNGLYLAQILTRGPSANRSITRSDFHSSPSSSNNRVNKSITRLNSLDYRSHATTKKGAHSSKKNDIMKNKSYYAARQDLLKRLEQGSSEERLGNELKVMINIMERMNTLLLGLSGTTIVGAPRLNMNACTINQGTALAAQMKHYFYTLGRRYERQIDNIAEIRSYLPILGPHLKSTLVRTALKIWNERIIITYVHPSHQLFLSPALETHPPKREPNEKKLNPETQHTPRFSPAPRTRYIHPPLHLLRHPGLHHLPPEAAIPLQPPPAPPRSHPPGTDPAIHGARLRHPRNTHTRDRKPSHSNERSTNPPTVSARPNRLHPNTSPGALLPTHDSQAGAKSARGGYSPSREYS